MDINAVQQWTRDPLLTFGDHRMRTGAGLLRVAVESTGARIHTIELIFPAQLQKEG